MRMFLYFIAAFSALNFCSSLAFAEEGEAEKKPKEGAEAGESKEPEKPPRPDSAISSATQLPEVIAWKQWMESKGSRMAIWGESIRSLENQQCWGVAVGEEPKSKKERPHVWRHFCITQGGAIWVESMPTTPAEEAALIPYEKWQKKCKPTVDSPGVC